MKQAILIFLLLTAIAAAAQSFPDITDNSGVSVTIGVPVVLSGSGATLWQGVKQSGTPSLSAGYDYGLYVGSDTYLHCLLSAALGGGNCLPASMVYPGAGIPNSTGSAWGTSYATSGSGSICLTTSCVMNTPSATHPSLNTDSSIGAATGSGLYITSSGLTAGSIYYQTSTPGTLAAAKADAAGTVPAFCVAISTTGCMYSGVWRFSATQSWTAGNVLYVSDASAGAIVTTAPSTSGHFIQRIGVALDVGTMLMQPSLDVGTVQ